MSESRIDAPQLASRHRVTPFDYVAMMRLDHSTKHIFILPGMMLALLLRGVWVEHPALAIAQGLVAAVCVASANYLINEWLDREFDKHHPEKSARVAVQRDVSEPVIWTIWVALLAVGLSAAAWNSPLMFGVVAMFGMQGVVYNIPPIRTKDKAYLDVISEAINNPLRLMIGWAMFDPTTLPPASIIVTYWTGGAFLMAAKRFSEYREIVASHGRELLVRYRASFRTYTDVSLMTSCFVYAMISTSFLGVFLIKYRVEYILLVPVVVALFARYLVMSSQAGSTAQKPERLFRERGLIVLMVALLVCFNFTTWVDIPGLDRLATQRFIEVP